MVDRSYSSLGQPPHFQMFPIMGLTHNLRIYKFYHPFETTVFQLGEMVKTDMKRLSWPDGSDLVNTVGRNIMKSSEKMKKKFQLAKSINF